MAGIYIHVPFCKSKCGYCGFYSLPSLKQKACFLEALKAEIVRQKDYLQCGELRAKPVMRPALKDDHDIAPIHTLYFGGGTPSLLSVNEIGDILHLIRDIYTVTNDAEITLEANPDTLSLEYLQGLRNIGVNRLSIGIQSFFDNDLQYLGRKHDSSHAKQCLEWAKQSGFSNISIDLIYGLPSSNAKQWSQNLDIFFSYCLPHLSAYALTLERNSILTKQIEQGKTLPINDDDALRDYDILCQRTKEKGYLHYEISNFCHMGMHSKHNASYWFGTPYLGLGPSAHSFDGHSRQWNVASVEKYCQNVSEPADAEHGRNAEEPTLEKEHLSPEQLYDEYVMLRLRTHWGIDLKWLKREMGERFSSYCEQQALPLVAQGIISQTREFLYLNDQQMLFADGIAEKLFWE